MNKLRMLSTLTLLLMLGGCQLVVDFDRSKISDAAADGTTDSAMGDAAMDATDDASGDAMTDASDDAMPDALGDAMMDAAGDAMMDAAGDAMADAMADATPDAMMDAAPDAMMDATMDTMDTAVAPVCGNGMVEAPEVCDDGNTMGCGTCSADCMTAQPLATATGSITVASVPADGGTFTLDDGVNAATVFEFDDEGSTMPSRVAIDVSAATTVDDVRDAITAAVNGVAGTLAITATSGASGVVDLSNDVMTALGNVLIARTATEITSTGMAGGSARDCGSGVGCAAAGDCASMACTTMTCD